MIELLTKAKLKAVHTFLIFVAVIAIIHSRCVLSEEIIETVDVLVDCSRAVNKTKCIEAKLTALVGDLQGINLEIALIKSELRDMADKKEHEQLSIAKQIDAISLSQRTEFDKLLSRFIAASVAASDERATNLENKIKREIDQLNSLVNAKQEPSDRLAIEFRRLSDISDLRWAELKSHIEEERNQNEKRMKLTEERIHVLDQRFFAFEALLSKYAKENQKARTEMDSALQRISSEIEQLSALKSRRDNQLKIR